MLSVALKFVLLVYVLCDRCSCYRMVFPSAIEKTSRYWDRLARKQGPNTCVKETLPNTGLTYDRAWTGGHYCNDATRISYECCYGYGTVRGEPGCPLVLPVTSTKQTADSVKAGLFVRMMEDARTWQTVNQESFTLLLPLDNSLRAIPHHVLSYINYTSTYPSFLSQHLVKGRQDISRTVTDIVHTSLNSEQPIRFNVFPNGLSTVNCVPVVKTNLVTTQGLVHVLESPLPTNYLYTIADSIMRNIQLRRFADYIMQGRFESLLRAEGPFTVFAPSDDAFNKMAHHHVHSILYDEEALKSLVNHHIVLGVQCSAILQTGNLRTRLGTSYKADCSRTGTQVGGAKLEKSNDMATNGVIHVIDRVLLPRRAQLMHDVISELRLTTLASLIQTAGLESVFKGTSQITLFAPTNNAFDVLSPAFMNSLKYRSNAAHGVVTDHMSNGRHLVRDIRDKQTLQSRGSRQDFRFKFKRIGSMVDKAVVKLADIECLNGVIHIIDTVMLPTKQTVIQYLTSQGNYSRFLNALKMTTPSLYTILESSGGPYTVFAVPDGYIDHWSTDLFAYHRMLGDSRLLNALIRNHVVEDAVFMSILQDGEYQRITTNANEPLLLKKLSNNVQNMYAGIASFIDRDILCTNGVVHVVNRIIQVPNPS